MCSEWKVIYQKLIVKDQSYFGKILYIEMNLFSRIKEEPSEIHFPELDEIDEVNEAEQLLNLESKKNSVLLRCMAIIYLHVFPPSFQRETTSGVWLLASIYCKSSTKLGFLK